VQSLLRVIQQRKLDRVAAAYSVAAWLVVQAFSIALPTFGAPSWVLKTLIVLAVGGLPITLWIAWHMTPPHHHRRHAAPTPASTPTDIALLALLALVVVASATEIVSQTGLFSAVSRHGVAGNAGAVSAPPSAAPSIAVLPFTNMSGDASKDYFSDGISEELSNQLANAPDLRVAARTSSFAFKGKSEDIRAIGRALNVQTVLEGSVREDGRHVRITAQLINAADGFHIWSKTYDRDLSNILQLQDDIAHAITASLTHRLLGNTPGNVSQKRTPIDPEAYRRYLQAQSLSALKTADDDARAIALFRAVIAVEPGFAPAYAALGRTYVHEAQVQNRRADLVAAAETALDRALSLDGHNLEALSSHLFVALMKWEWPVAVADARRLQALNPHSVFTLRGLDALYGSLGFPEQQAAALREATRLDPLSFVDLNNLATVYNDRGEFAEAGSAAGDGLALRPGRALTLYTLCVAYAGERRSDRAADLARQLLALNETAASEACALKRAAALGQKGEAHALADSIAARFPAFVFGDTSIGNFYLAAGDPAAALTWFRRAYDDHDMAVFALPYLPTTPKDFLASAAWAELRKRPDSVAWQAAHDRLEAALAAD
jgi:TolB-like protein